MTVREHITFWLDEQISVNSNFWSDLRWLVWLPIWPFVIIAWVWLDTVVIRQGALVVGPFLCIPWGGFIFHRRRIKKRDWVEPSRFTDENGGY